MPQSVRPGRSCCNEGECRTRKNRKQPTRSPAAARVAAAASCMIRGNNGSNFDHAASAPRARRVVTRSRKMLKFGLCRAHSKGC
jgi:hypothetical protein